MKKRWYTYYCPAKQISKMGLDVQENVLGKSVKSEREGARKGTKSFIKPTWLYWRRGKKKENWVERDSDWRAVIKRSGQWGVLLPNSPCNW